MSQLTTRAELRYVTDNSAKWHYTVPVQCSRSGHTVETNWQCKTLFFGLSAAFDTSYENLMPQQNIAELWERVSSTFHFCTLSGTRMTYGIPRTQLAHQKVLEGPTIAFSMSP